MRFLVDANLSPRVAQWLHRKGCDAAHVFDLGLTAASDREIFAHAARDGWTVVTSDLDFGDILARSGGGAHVVVLRLRSNTTASVTARLERVLAHVVPALEAGSVVIVEETRLRIRRLTLSRRGA